METVHGNHAVEFASKKFFLRYDTIRYDTVCLRALKSWRDGQFNLAYGTETKNNKENKKITKKSKTE